MAKKKKKEAIMWLGSQDSYAEYEEDLARIEGISEEEISKIETRMFPADEERDFDSPLIEVTDGIAVISIAGSLTDRTGRFLLYFGMTPYTMIYDAIVEAALSSTVDSILLSIDSNGGTVSGISHALEGIREAAQIKAIYTHTASNMNSAAYWIGSSGTEVMADRMAEVGSIGVIAVMLDFSKAMKDKGVIPHVFRAGEFKALGMPYEEMTDKAAKTIQARIDARYDQFLEDVAINRGRTKNTVKADMAQGRVFLAKDALSVGLIDSVMSFNDAFRLVRSETSQSDSDRLRGNQGIGASASDTELPIQSQEGEDMPKKKLVNKQVQAAVAEGVKLETALETMGTEVDKSAEGATTTGEEAPETTIGAGDTSEGAPAAPAKVKDKAPAGDKAPAEEANGDGAGALLALVAQVGTLSQSLAEANAEAKTLKSQADVAQAQVGSLKTIAADSITRMSIAIGATVQDLSSMSAENLLALHETTRADFNKRLPVGQHVETSENDTVVDEAVDSINLHLASLTSK